MSARLQHVVAASWVFLSACSLDSFGPAANTGGAGGARGGTTTSAANSSSAGDTSASSVASTSSGTTGATTDAAASSSTGGGAVNLPFCATSPASDTFDASNDLSAWTTSSSSKVSLQSGGGGKYVSIDGSSSGTVSMRSKPIALGADPCAVTVRFLSGTSGASGFSFWDGGASVLGIRVDDGSIVSAFGQIAPTQSTTLAVDLALVYTAGKLRAFYRDAGTWKRIDTDATSPSWNAATTMVSLTQFLDNNETLLDDFNVPTITTADAQL